MRLLLLGLLIMSFMPAQAEIVQIFGLPLGGKPHPAIKICKLDEIGSEKALCLVSKPFVSKDGSKLGVLSIPEKNLPRWAAHSSPEISLEKDGTISAIAFSTKNSELSNIVSSISLRFGSPSGSNSIGTRIPSVSWQLDNIFIHVTQWGERCCDVDFRTPGDIAKQKAYWAEHNKNEASRPRSP